MSMRYLGPSFDIHTGGVDLVFPHHEDEIAQSEAATGQPFVHTWLHCAHLQMGGEKMAKRTGNITRPAEVYAAGLSARGRCATRSWPPTTARRSSSATRRWPPPTAAVERLATAVGRAGRLHGGAPTIPRSPAHLERRPRSPSRRRSLTTSTSRPPWRPLFDLVRELNGRVGSAALSTADARRAAAALRELDRGPGCPGATSSARMRPGGPVAAMLEARVAARAARDWARSDELRDALAAAGIVVEDTRDGQRWRTDGAPMADLTSRNATAGGHQAGTAVGTRTVVRRGRRREGAQGRPGGAGRPGAARPGGHRPAARTAADPGPYRPDPWPGGGPGPTRGRPPGGDRPATREAVTIGRRPRDARRGPRSPGLTGPAGTATRPAGRGTSHDATVTGPRPGGPPAPGPVAPSRLAGPIARPTGRRPPVRRTPPG